MAGEMLHREQDPGLDQSPRVLPAESRSTIRIVAERPSAHGRVQRLACKIKHGREIQADAEGRQIASRYVPGVPGSLRISCRSQTHVAWQRRHNAPERRQAAALLVDTDERRGVIRIVRQGYIAKTIGQCPDLRSAASVSAKQYEPA